jgi:hypothetical protein
MSETTPSNSTTRDGAADWGFEWTAAACPSCKSTFLMQLALQAEARALTCPACFSAALAPYGDYPLRPSPEMVLPFGVDRGRTEAALAAWAGSVWLRAPDMDAGALSSRLARVFIPMWLVDGKMIGSWQAQAGYEYQVASSHDAFNNGQWSSRKVTETRLRWEPRLGTIQRAYQNMAVPAVEAHSRLAPRAGAFPIEKAGAYDPGLVRDAHVLLPDIPPEGAFPIAKMQFDQAAGRDCQAAAGAQRVEQVGLRCDYQGLNWTLLLMPVYTSYYREENGTLRPLLVNGATGRVSGVKRASQKKAWRWTGAMAAIGVLCILAALVIGMMAAAMPPAVAVSWLLFVLGAGVALASPAPVIWVWNFNRKEQE